MSFLPAVLPCHIRKLFLDQRRNKQAWTMWHGPLTSSKPGLSVKSVWEQGWTFTSSFIKGRCWWLLFKTMSVTELREIQSIMSWWRLGTGPKVQTETSITGDEEVRQSLGQKSHLLEKLKSKMTHESSVLEGLQWFQVNRNITKLSTESRLYGLVSKSACHQECQPRSLFSPRGPKC